jgi:hypothetical protein
MQFFRDLDWGNWLYGLFYGSIGGGANSVSGALGAVIVDPKHFAFGSAASFKLMGVIFLLTFMKDASLYLAQKPLPPIKTVTTTETVQQTTRPASTITTTIEQTQMSANPQGVLK